MEMTIYFSYVCTPFNNDLLSDSTIATWLINILSTTPPKVPGDKKTYTPNVNVIILSELYLNSIYSLLQHQKDRVYEYVVITDKEQTDKDNLHYVEKFDEALTVGHKLTKNKSKLYIIDEPSMVLSSLAFKQTGLEQIYELNFERLNCQNTEVYQLGLSNASSLELPLTKLFKQIVKKIDNIKYTLNIWWKAQVASEEDEYLNLFRKILTENGIQKDFENYLEQKLNRESDSDYDINDVLKKHLNNVRSDRTKVGTLSSFDLNVTYYLDKYFPLTTTKRMWWYGILQEFLWILSGSTNSKDLADKKVHIWDANSTREFLDKRGLQYYPEGQLGPIYGYQWRHSGAKFDPLKHIQEGGIDQIQQVIDQLKKDPYDRRMIVNCWIPDDISKMALPTCHHEVQFLVDHERKLCAKPTQRSGDTFLAAGSWNATFYGILLHVIAHLTGFKVGRLSTNIVDCHIYKFHLEQVFYQLTQPIRPAPQLIIKREVKDVDDFKFEDFELQGYEPHQAIDGEMAV
jgi:thymidylate synthase